MPTVMTMPSAERDDLRPADLELPDGEPAVVGREGDRRRLAAGGRPREVDDPEEHEREAKRGDGLDERAAPGQGRPEEHAVAERHHAAEQDARNPANPAGVARLDDGVRDEGPHRPDRAEREVEYPGGAVEDDQPDPGEGIEPAQGQAGHDVGLKFCPARHVTVSVPWLCWKSASRPAARCRRRPGRRRSAGRRPRSGCTRRLWRPWTNLPLSGVTV